MSVRFTPTEDTRQLAIRVDEEEYLLSNIAVDADHVEIDATDPQNPVTLADKVSGWDEKVSTISVNSGTPIAPTAGNVNIVIPESGHKIKANDGSTDMTQRSGLQFVNANIADDSTNNKTVVTIPIASGSTNGLTKMFYGTRAEALAAISSGSITDNAVVYISDDTTGGGGSGHIIINSAGTEMTQRSGLKFVGVTVTDDSNNDMTVVAIDPGFGFEVVASTSAVTNPNNHTFYLIKDTSVVGDDKYKIYIWDSVNGFTLIDDTSLDLTNYVQNTDYATSSVGGVVKVDGTNMEINSSGEITAKKVNGYSVNKDVPSDAVFTDTQHTIVDENGTTFSKRSKLKFVNATITDDNTNDTTIVEVQGGGTTIVQKPTVTVGTYTYDGTAQGPTITGLDSDKVIVTNATKTNAGTYILTIALKNTSTMVWNDITTADLTYEYTISKATVTCPAVTDTSKIYNGSEQGPTIASYDSTKLTVSGNTAINAGDYTVIFTLVDSDNYQLSGTNNVAWSIAKANQTITLSSNSVILDPTHLTATVTVSGAEGVISVSSSDSTIATASVSGSTVTISNVNQANGSVNITVSVSGTSNYNAATDSIIAVTASFYIFPDKWLESGGLNPSSYADLDAVLADEIALRRLFTIHDSVDHLVENKTKIGTTNLTTILNNDYCAKWINLRDYALDTLYADSTLAGIMDTADKYFYGEWVITDSTTTPVTWGPKGNVPVMTSNTAPYGTALASTNGGFTTSAAYKAFDNDLTTAPNPSGNSNVTNNFIGYTFTNPCLAKKCSFAVSGSAGNTRTFKIQSSNDGFSSDIKDIGEKVVVLNNTYQTFDVDLTETDYRLSYRLFCEETLYIPSVFGCSIISLQFYGREMKVSVPTMTSNTAPYGEAFGSSHIDSGVPWYAFDNNDDTYFIGISTDVTNRYVGYKFMMPVKVQCLYSRHSAINTRVLNIKLQASNDGINWDNIYNYNVSITGHTSTSTYETFSNNVSYLYYRLFCDNIDGNDNFYASLQFYGFDYSEYDWDTDNPRHYIYDHGVELEELIIRKGSNAINKVENTNNELYISTAETSGSESMANYATIFSNIDLSDYSLARAIIGNVIATPVSSNATEVRVLNSIDNYPNEGSNYSNPTQIAGMVLTIPISNPNNVYALDISSISTSVYIGFVNAYYPAKKTTVTEWWLE